MLLLFKQLLKFMGVSGIGWCLDFILYTILAFCGVNLFWDNICGAVLGVSFVFIFSTRYIFKNEGNIPLWAKYFIYVTYQIILVIIISKILVIINSFLLVNFAQYLNEKTAAVLSKILITPLTMICNFIVLKNIIEKI